MGLVCFDMDRVLVTHDSTWQWVYDRLGVSNEESLIAYEAGALHEWEWLQKDLRLIEGGCHRMLGRSVTVNDLRAWTEDVPLDHGLDACIAGLLDDGHDVAIISGGMNAPAHRIAARFPSTRPWVRRWGGIDPWVAATIDGRDSRLHVFSNGWLERRLGGVEAFGRYQVEMHGKGRIVQMLQRRLGHGREATMSIGDSMGDVSMFERSGFSICWNPKDERPTRHSTLTLVPGSEGTLTLALDAFRGYIAPS